MEELETFKDVETTKNMDQSLKNCLKEKKTISRIFLKTYIKAF